jgi:hypothetical protein
MQHIWAFQSLVTTLVVLALLAFKIWAFVDAAVRRPDAFVAAGKMTKPAWLLILGLSALVAFLWPSPLGLLSIVGTVASLVYLLDARPGLVSVTRRR